MQTDGCASKCENEDVSVPSFVLCGLAVDDIVPSLIPRLIDMLRYYLHLGVLGVPVLPVCGGEWSLVVHFDDLCLFQCGSLIGLRPSVCMYI